MLCRDHLSSSSMRGDFTLLPTELSVCKSRRLWKQENQSVSQCMWTLQFICGEMYYNMNNRKSRTRNMTNGVLNLPLQEVLWLYHSIGNTFFLNLVSKDAIN